MGSHDEQWLMCKMRQHGACTAAPAGGATCDPDLLGNALAYNVRHLPVALDRLKMAGAFFYLVPGPRMLWQFQKRSYGYSDNGEQCLRSNDRPPIAPRSQTNPVGLLRRPAACDAVWCLVRAHQP